MNISEDRLKEITHNVAKNYDLKSWKYTPNKTMKAIENYFGVLIPVILRGNKHTDHSEDTVTLHLLLKVVPNNVEERMKTVLEYLYAADVFFYTTLVPIYSCLAEVTVDELVPNCYYADLQPENEVLALQDMTYAGYTRCRKSQRFLDFDHIVVALEALSKFHACSVLTLEKGLEPASGDILTPYTDTHPIELNIAIKMAFDHHLKYFNGTKYENYLKELTGESRYSSIRLNSFQKVRRLVYGHGDYWKENILFKYKDDSPIKACIVDFQTMRSMCPAQDFLSFIIVSTDASTRANCYEHFLSIYLNSIKTVLAKCNEKLASSYEEDFNHDLRVVAENCLLLSFMGFALWYGLEDCLNSLLKSKVTLSKTAVSNFVNTISNIIHDLEKLGYISL